MSVPAMPVPVNVVLDAELDLMALLVRVQLPPAPVTQLALPPTENVPVTLAFATFAPVLTSRTVTSDDAFQLPPERVALPASALKATDIVVGCNAGVLAPASEFNSRVGEPVPA